MSDLNLLIPGVPKAGTTSLFDYLVQHKNIDYFGKEKETFHLMDERHPLRKELGTVSASVARYRVDATVHYMYQKRALDYFKNNIDCKAIFIFRDPIERLRSAFSFIKYSHSAMEKNYTYNNYIEDLLVNGDRARKKITTFHLATAMQELENGLYYKYFKKWVDVDKDRCMVLDFDDLRENPGQLYQSVLKWLDLPVDLSVNFDKKNQTFKPKSGTLNKCVKIISRNYPFLRDSKSLRYFYNLTNVPFNNSEQLSSKLKGQLKEYYKIDMRMFSALVKTHYQKDISFD